MIVTDNASIVVGLPTVQGGPFPPDVVASVTSPYGPREPFQTPAGWTSGFHDGIDLWAWPTPPLVALMDGVVEYAGSHREVGNWVRVRSGEWSWDYYHMQDAPTHRAGDEVKRGDAIGTVGSTGLSTAPHLHLLMTLNGESIDPLVYLRSVESAVESVEAEVSEVERKSNVQALELVLDLLRSASAVAGQVDGQWIGVLPGAPEGYRDVVTRVRV
jgi:murein DD-endopeptidase MepM/ murein hydrolase activator NlpD